MTNLSENGEVSVARITSHLSTESRRVEMTDHRDQYQVLMSRPTPEQDRTSEPKAPVRVSYKECLKNHAAAIGGNSIDGCGEFMPNGEAEGTLEAFKCSACGCHRNFHRKELEGINSPSECFQYSRCYHHPCFKRSTATSVLGYHPTGVLVQAADSKVYMQGGGGMLPANTRAPLLPSESEEDKKMVAVGRPNDQKIIKKRVRTKFTEEQKQKMLSFAEDAGWKIQKLEESVVQEFCQEIGINKRVLKVWIHNNKHSSTKGNSSGK